MTPQTLTFSFLHQNNINKETTCRLRRSFHDIVLSLPPNPIFCFFFVFFIYIQLIFTSNQLIWWTKWMTNQLQESPPAWTQEAYRPPCSEYSFCCPTRVPPPGGYLTRVPPQGGPGTPQGGLGIPPGGTWPGYPPGGDLTGYPPGGCTRVRYPPQGGYLGQVPPRGGYPVR